MMSRHPLWLWFVLVLFDNAISAVCDQDDSRCFGTDQFVVRLAADADAAEIAKRAGFSHIISLSSLENNLYIFSHHNLQLQNKPVELQREESRGFYNTIHGNFASVIAASLTSEPHVLWFAQQMAKPRYPRTLHFNDPFFPRQWYLGSSCDSNDTCPPNNSFDIHILPVWEGLNLTLYAPHHKPSSNTALPPLHGEGVVVAIVDDGLQHIHPEISGNYVPSASWDFCDNDPDPSPSAFTEFHGTACAGVVGAVADNGHCGIGAAYKAGIAGIRLTSRPPTDAVETLAFGYRADVISVLSCSWGPADDGTTLDGPGPLTSATIEQLVAGGRGRAGRGSIVVFAAGNGRQTRDNVNYDGYCNSPYTIAVGAASRFGESTGYSEEGAALLLVAPSSRIHTPGAASGGDDVITADADLSADGDGCLRTFGGTSAAAPLVAGVVAMAIQANTELTWLDVQRVLVDTAKPLDANDTDWQRNAAGYAVNHKYGFGLVDAAAAVAMATAWQPRGWRITNPPLLCIVNRQLPFAAGVALESTLDVSAATVAELLDVDNVDKLTEYFLTHVMVQIAVEHEHRGDLRVVLTSPSGTPSVLADTHGFVTMATVTLDVNVADDDDDYDTTAKSSFTFAAAAADFAAHADIGKPISVAMTTAVVAEPDDACSELKNATLLAGTVVVVRRGVCSAIDKVRRVAAAGAIGVVIINSVAGEPPFALPGYAKDLECFPAVMVSFEDGEVIMQSLNSGDYAKLSISLIPQKTNPLLGGYSWWQFDTTRCWGEKPVGTWKLTIADADGRDEKSVAMLIGWKLVFLFSGGPSPVQLSVSPPPDSNAGKGQAFSSMLPIIIIASVCTALACITTITMVACVIIIRTKRKAQATPAK